MIVQRNLTTSGVVFFSPSRWLVTVNDKLCGVRLGIIWRGRVLVAWRFS